MTISLIKGSKHYCVNAHGDVFSLKPHGKTKYILGPFLRKLRVSDNGHGYKCVKLEGRWRYVHRLVLETFEAAPKSGQDCNHKNGVKSDNRLSNLEWVTRSQNMRHCVDVLGKKNGRGEDAWARKLSNDDVRRIRELRKGGMTFAAIAKIFAMDESWIWRVATKEAWSHVE